MTDSRPRILNLRQLINPTEKQLAFLEALTTHDYVLYGGAAGGGKSYILRWWLVFYLVWLYKSQGLRNVQVALCSEDYPSLADRQISKIQFEFPPTIGELKQGIVRNFQLLPELGSGVIALRNLDDPSKYQSAEFAAIAVDELTKNDKSTFDFLRSRLRWSGVDRPKFAAGANPGGIGHAWVKKLWIDKDFPAEMQPIADKFAFIQSKASDNPHLTQSYYDSLLTLDPEMAKMFAEGDWNLFVDQYFARMPLILKPEDIKLQKWARYWLSGDWGDYHPCCIHLHAQDSTGKVYTIDELWGRHIPERDLGNMISWMCEGMQIDAFTFSWDAFGKLNKETQRPITELISEGLSDGIPHPSPADSSPGSRISGWRHMKQMINEDKWAVSSKCKKLIECIPTLVRDMDRNSEDVLKVDWNQNCLGDDAADSARYGLQYMLNAPKIPFEVRVRERVEKIEDMSQRMIALGTVMAEERKGTLKPIKLRRPTRWMQRYN